MSSASGVKMADFFAIVLFIVAVFGLPFGAIVGTLAFLGTRDRRARTDPAGLVLALIALVVNLAICVYWGAREWFFWPSAVALAGSVVAAGRCLAARFQ
jgi:hypothetical protein